MYPVDWWDICGPSNFLKALLFILSTKQFWLSVTKENCYYIFHSFISLRPYQESAFFKGTIHNRRVLWVGREGGLQNWNFWEISKSYIETQREGSSQKSWKTRRRLLCIVPNLYISLNVNGFCNANYYKSLIKANINFVVEECDFRTRQKSVWKEFYNW